MLVLYRFKYVGVLILSLVAYLLLFVSNSLIISDMLIVGNIVLWLGWLMRIKIANSTYTRKIMFMVFFSFFFVFGSILFSMHTGIWFLSEMLYMFIGVLVIVLLFSIVHLYFLARYHHSFYTFEAVLALFTILGIFATNTIYGFAVSGLITYLLARIALIIILSLFIVIIALLLEYKWIALSIIILILLTTFSKMPFFWYIFDFLLINSAVFVFAMDHRISDIEKKYAFGDISYKTYKIIFILVILVYLKIILGI